MPSCRRLDLLCAVGLVFLPLAIFGPALVTGKVVSSADNLLDQAPWHALAPGYRSYDPTLSDISQFLHPYAIFAAREIRAGRFPLWNPYAFAGVPFFAHPHSATLFPLTALAYVLPLTTALTLAAALKLAAAGVAMYWFLRTLSLTPAGALIGALAFQLSGPMVGWLLWPFSSTMIFLPLLFGLAERLRVASGARPVALIAVTVALDLFAGYPQGAFQDVVAATAWTLMRAVGAGAPAALLVRWAGGVTLGAALAAIQIVPFLEYLPESAVFAYRAQWTPTLTVPFRATLTALMPYFFGRGAEYVGDWHLSIVLVFVGVVPLVVLPIAVVAGRHNPKARFFIGLALLTAAVNYGMPIVSGIAGLPVMSLMRNLVLSHLTVFSICALAAIAVDETSHLTATRWVAVATKVWAIVLAWIALGSLLALDESRQANLWPQDAWFVVTLTVAAIIVLVRLRAGGGRGSAIALVAVQAISALPFVVTYNPVIEATRFYPTPPLVSRLQRATRDGSRVTLTGSTGTVYRLFEMQGFDAMTPRRIEEVVGAIGSGRATAMGFHDNPLAVHGDEPLSAVKVVRSPAFDLFGVRYVVVGPREASPRPGLVLDYDGPDARVWRNDAALPRAFVAFSARCVDDQAGLSLIRQGRVPFRDEVLLGDCDHPPITGRSGAGSATIERYDATAVTIAAATDVPGFLVLTDTWFPGWRARLDGREVPIMRADHAFRAVSLPAGQHRVEFVYRPTSVWIGLIVTGLAVPLVLALGLWREAHPVMSKTVRIAVIVLALSLAPTPTSARLPPSPFDLEISPARVSEGGSVTIQVAPATRSPAGVDRHDVYVMWAYAEEAAFLTPQGAWSPVPVALVRDTSVQGAPTVRVTWNGVRPVMDIPLAVLVVPAGADPLDRARWTWRPVIRWVGVRARSRPWALTSSTLLLGFVTAAGSVAIAFADTAAIRLRRP